MNDVNNAALLSLLRSVLISLGAGAITHGYLTSDEVNGIAGAVLVIATALWEAFQKYEAEQKTQQRESVAMQAGMASVGAADPPPSITPKGTKP